MFLFHAQKYLVIFGVIYVFIVLLLAVPYFQSQYVFPSTFNVQRSTVTQPSDSSALYLNAVKLPLFANFDTPEKYGLAPNRTLNLKIQTRDNETIGAWFVLSDPYYHSLPSIPTNVAAHVIPALKDYPVILFFHGNAATRAFSARIQHYQGFSSRLGANILAIDYRGFADSTGQPSEVGLLSDARSAFDWLVAHGKRAEDILIVGHSLGTGVSGMLGAELSSEGINCRGIVLLSPFTSITEVLHTYNIFGFIPLMKPLSVIPGAIGLVQRALVHRFDTLRAVPNITATSVLIAHAENDWEIPDSHSDVLFQAFLERQLPPLDIPSNVMAMSKEDWEIVEGQQKARQNKRNEILKSTTLANFGRIDEFSEDGRKVVLVKTLAGGHDYLGLQEGLQDIIGRTFAIGL